jgi:nicotinate-nucleotide--dimethylbenzimidazole phosphoribosyltransferase
MSRPFDDLRALLADLPGPDEAAAARTRERTPPGLGGLGELAVWLSAWSGRSPPRVSRPVFAVYAGANGVASALGAAPDPAATRARLEAMAAGGAAVNALARQLGAGLDAFDLALDRPVGDITRGPAMTEKACAGTVAFGMEALAKTPDLLLVDAIGAGTAIAAGAVAHALHRGEAVDWATAEAASVVAAAVARASGEGGSDPLDTLRQLGGREIAAAAGAILAARIQRVPVILDGYGAAAAAAVLQALRPDAVAHCLAAQGSPEPGHRRILDALGLAPLLDLHVAAGEGAGAAPALALAQLACALHADA